LRELLRKRSTPNFPLKNIQFLNRSKINIKDENTTNKNISPNRSYNKSGNKSRLYNMNIAEREENSYKFQPSHSSFDIRENSKNKNSKLNNSVTSNIFNFIFL